MIRRYFDWAATALPGTFTAETPFGNPSSKHTEGRLAREALEAARRRCAAVLGVPAERLYFTSGGTEANALVILAQLLRGAGCGAGRDAGRNGTGSGSALLVSAGEHPSVRENAALLGRLGRSVQTVGLEREGWVSRSGLETALARCGDPRFAALMAVNNETGAVSDIGALARLLRNREGPPIHFHSDLVQALGKIPLDMAAWDIDSAAMSAHKLGGPRGVGLLYLKRPLEPLYRGGGQEGGLRPGTENTAGALALAECLEKRAQPGTVAAAYAEAALRMKALISALKELPRCKLIPQDRQAEDHRFSPWILQAAFEGIPGEVMVRCLDDAGFAVSTGSACSSGEKRRPVLAAMGIGDTTAFEGIRISQGWSTSREDLEALTGAVKDMLWKL